MALLQNVSWVTLFLYYLSVLLLVDLDQVAVWWVMLYLCTATYLIDHAVKLTLFEGSHA